LAAIAVANKAEVEAALTSYGFEANVDAVCAELHTGGRICFHRPPANPWDWGFSLTLTPPSKQAIKAEKDRERRAFFAAKRKRGEDK